MGLATRFEPEETTKNFSAIKEFQGVGCQTYSIGGCRKLAKAKEGLAIALSEEAATRVELDKLSSNVIAWREKVAEAERELAGVERNVSFCNQQQIKFYFLISCHSDRM